MPEDTESTETLVIGTVSELPKNVEYFQLVGRYNAGHRHWCAVGSLHRNQIDAVGDLSTFQYEETRIVRVILPR